MALPSPTSAQVRADHPDLRLVSIHRQRQRLHQRRLLVGALLVVDVLALALALGVAWWLRLVIDSVLPLASLGWTDRHIAASVIAVPILIGLFWMQGRYDVDNSLEGTRDYAHIAHGVTYGVTIALALSYFSGGEPFVSRSWLLLVWAMSIVCVCLARFVARRVVRGLRRRGFLHTRVAIVGASSFSVDLAEQFLASDGEGIDVVGFLDEYLPLGQPLLDGISVIGRPGDLINRRPTDPVDEYIFVPEALPHERLEEITRLMVSQEGPVFRMAVSSRDLLTHGVLVAQRGHVPLVTLQRARIRGFDMVLKRALDIAGALLALMAIAPVALVAIARSQLAGRRPMLVPQFIHAPGGGKTRLWLLAQEVSGSIAVRGAPALLAVLSGQLSLVGPRPVPWQSGGPPRGLWVTAVSPGLTGPWRLSGPQASMENQMLQDLAYVRNYNIWEDLRILWRSARPGALLGRWQASNSRTGPHWPP
jgi:lipopolysaccharide/colanic/teichoic acid biosynthesis glycosyltransferase